MPPTRIALAAVAIAALLPATVPAHADAANVIPQTLKPIAGIGAAPDQPFLLNVVVGRKQLVSYFQNEAGICKASLMVGAAFDGENVPDETAVRFEASIAPAKSTLFDTAEGKGLELTCLEGAEALGVRTLDQTASYAPVR